MTPGVFLVLRHGFKLQVDILGRFSPHGGESVWFELSFSQQPLKPVHGLLLIFTSSTCVCVCLRSVQTEPTAVASPSETCSWFPCRGFSNITCCYRCVHTCLAFFFFFFLLFKNAWGHWLILYTERHSNQLNERVITQSRCAAVWECWCLMKTISNVSFRVIQSVNPTLAACCCLVGCIFFFVL